MAAPVEQKVNATYFKSSSTQPCCCQQNEGNFHLYMHQIAAGPDVNQKVAVNPDNPTTAFGEFVVNDWSITEGPDPASKLVARAQGMHVGVGHIKLRWYFSCNIVFEDERYTIYGSIYIIMCSLFTYIIILFIYII
jgi:Dirigent-like protein